MSYHAAIDYATRGWHIFPVRPAGGDPTAPKGSPEHLKYKESKRPLTDNGKDDATTDVAQIKAWWEKWPTARIGIVGGPSGLLPVDWDTEKVGLAGLDEIAAAAGVEFPDTREVRTPSGGVHRYYLLPAGGPWTDRMENHTSAVCTKINGYLILPSEGSGYSWKRIMDPVALPEALVAALLKPEAVAGPGPQSDEELDERQAQLAAIVADLGLGEYRWKHGTGIDEKGRVILELEDCPFDAAGHSGPYKAVLGVGSNGGIFAGCVVDGCADKGWWDLQPEAKTKVPLTNKRRLPTRERLIEAWLDERLLGVEDMLALPSIEWLVPGLLQVGATSQIVGPSTGGKSLWTLQTCIDLTMAGKTVVYCALEGKNGFKGRLMAQAKERGTQAFGRLYFYDLRVLLQHEETVAELRDTVTAIDADVIVLDTLVRAAPGVKENDAGEMQELIEQAESLKHRRDVAVWMLHHSGHDQSRGRGSSAVPAAMDNTVFIFPVAGNDGKEGRDLVVKVYSDKVKDGRQADTTLLKKHEHLLGHLSDGSPWTSVVFRPEDGSGYEKTGRLEKKARDLLEGGVKWGAARNKVDGSERAEFKEAWERLLAEGVGPIELD